MEVSSSGDRVEPGIGRPSSGLRAITFAPGEAGPLPSRIDAAFDGFLLPLLGIVFLPFATLIYALLSTPDIGLTGWEWFWVVVAGLFDIVHWAASASQRSQLPGRRSSV